MTGMIPESGVRLEHYLVWLKLPENFFYLNNMILPEVYRELYGKDTYV